MQKTSSKLSKEVYDLPEFPDSRYLVVGGVPFVRTVLQVGFAALMVFFFHDAKFVRSQTEQIIYWIVLALIGLWVGKLIWDVIGVDLEAFLDDMFPWFDAFDPTTDEDDLLDPFSNL
jgi:hypothetical protein